MLDIELIRQQPESVLRRLQSKNYNAGLDGILSLDSERRAAINAFETARSEQKRLSKEIGEVMKTGGKADELRQRSSALSDEIKNLEAKCDRIERELQNALLYVPNLPDLDVPVAPDESGNQILEVFGERPTFSFAPKAHWDIAEPAGMLDIAYAAKLSGSGFSVLKGDLAKLERSLIDFMIGLHTTKHGYTEISTPFLVREEIMVGTGQLPKFADDMYRVDGNGLYLIPTAEVTIANIFRETVLKEDDLPAKFCGYTACFRKEAGAAGRDTRGLIRVHQFSKVELINIVKPELSTTFHQSMVKEACAVLSELGLHYRTLLLSTGDMSFSSAKTIDIEIFCPGVDKWLEVSSCSNCGDFQARRMKTRYKDNVTKSNRLVHVLNGSGVALPRLLIAILENYQQEDGRVRIPKALARYFPGQEYLGTR